MISEAERDIMARVRGASQNTAPEAIAAELDALDTPLAAPGESQNWSEVFCERLTRHGATVVAVADRSSAVAEISRLLSAHYGQRRVVAGYDPRLAAMPWREGGVLPRFGSAGADDYVAVSYALCGIVETGSLALTVDRNNPASNSLLVDDHIIIVETQSLRYRLEELWPHAISGDEAKRPRGVMLISGPSSTADIGMNLVTGAHGPQRLHVVLLGADARPEAIHP